MSINATLHTNLPPYLPTSLLHANLEVHKSLRKGRARPPQPQAAHVGHVGRFRGPRGAAVNNPRARQSILTRQAVRRQRLVKGRGGEGSAWGMLPRDTAAWSGAAGRNFAPPTLHQSSVRDACTTKAVLLHPPSTHTHTGTHAHTPLVTCNSLTARPVCVPPLAPGPTTRFLARWHSSKRMQPSKAGPHQAISWSRRDSGYSRKLEEKARKSDKVTERESE